LVERAWRHNNSDGRDEGAGYDGRVSSSFPDNPVGIKGRVVEEGMKASGITFGSLKNQPMRAVECLGDPMMAAAAGLASGLNVKTILAGGTQMVSVLCIIKALGLERDISIATTCYVANDGTANFREMTEILGYQAFAATRVLEVQSCKVFACTRRGK